MPAEQEEPVPPHTRDVRAPRRLLAGAAAIGLAAILTLPSGGPLLIGSVPIGYTAAHAAPGDPFTVDALTTARTGVPGEPVVFPFTDTVAAAHGIPLDPATVRLHRSGTTGATGPPAAGGNVLDTDAGTWTVDPATGDVTFTPADASAGGVARTTVSVADATGVISDPIVLTAVLPDIVDHTVAADQGAVVEFDILEGATAIAPDTVRLALAGMPPTTTLTTDGLRLVVPGEGTWTADPATGTVIWTPDPLSRAQPTPVTYRAATADGIPAAPAQLTVRVPSIPDMTQSAPFGQPVVFALGPELQNIDPSTLSLQVRGEPDGTVLDTAPDGRVLGVIVPGEGRWQLDESTLRVTFTPVSDQVRTAIPVFVTGADEHGNTSQAARLAIGYPLMTDQLAAAVTGQTARLDPLSTARNVAADTLRFAGEGQPAGAAAGPDGRRLDVPGQGVWTIQEATGAVFFDPAEGFTGSPEPVRVTATGVFGINPVGAVLRVRYADAVPIARDDAVATNPGETVEVPLLDNDEPAGPNTQLLPESVRLFSPRALDDESAEAGTRLEVPAEGIYELGPGGVVTFTPDPRFLGQAGPVEYAVTDSQGITVTATLTVMVRVDAEEASSPRPGGEGTLLQTLLDVGAAPFSVYGTITLLLLFSGAVALYAGRAMISDRERFQPRR